MCEEPGHWGCRMSTRPVVLQKMTMQFGPLYKAMEGNLIETTTEGGRGNTMELFALWAGLARSRVEGWAPQLSRLVADGGGVWGGVMRGKDGWIVLALSSVSASL